MAAATPFAGSCGNDGNRWNGPLQLSDPAPDGEPDPLQCGPAGRPGRAGAPAEAFAGRSAPVKLTAPGSQRQAYGPLTQGWLGVTRSLLRHYLECVEGSEQGGRRQQRRPPCYCGGSTRARGISIDALLAFACWDRSGSLLLQCPAAGAFARVLLDLGFNVAGNLIDRKARLLLARRIVDEGLQKCACVRRDLA